MKFIIFLHLQAFTAVVVCDDLEDFPLDGESAAVAADGDDDSSPDTTTGAEGDVPSLSADFDVDQELPDESP